MPHLFARSCRLVPSLLVALASATTACDDGTTPPIMGTLTLDRTEVVASIGQTLTLSAQPAGNEAQRAGARVRWQSQDPAVFRLDTLTEAPHRATARAVRVGVTTLILSSGGQTITVPVTVVTPQGAPRTATDARP